jgi:DNA-binding transcriptional MerR regulator
MMKPVMIGQLASETSTKVTTIRFYESIGCSDPPSHGVGSQNLRCQ